MLIRSSPLTRRPGDLELWFVWCGGIPGKLAEHVGSVSSLVCEISSGTTSLWSGDRLKTMLNKTGDPASKAHLKALRVALAIVLAMIAIACVQPGIFGFPQIGLDPSWVAAASYAAEKGLVFGSEVVFTSGPLSALYHRMYPVELAPVIVALDLIWATLFAAQLWKMFAPLLGPKASRD